MINLEDDIGCEMQIVLSTDAWINVCEWLLCMELIVIKKYTIRILKAYLSDWLTSRRKTFPISITILFALHWLWNKTYRGKINFYIMVQILRILYLVFRYDFKFLINIMW